MFIIDQFCRRFEERDAAAFAEMFTDEAVYVDSLYGAFRGREAIREFHRRCHEEAAEMTFIPVRKAVGSGGLYAFEWSFTFKSLSPRCKGKTVSLMGAGFLMLENGRITSYHEYADSMVILL